MQLLRDNLTLWTSSEADNSNSGQADAPKEETPVAPPAEAAPVTEEPKAAE